MWELSNGHLLIVDSTSQTDLLISDDKGTAWNEIDTGDFTNGKISRTTKIQMAYYDRGDDKIWFIDCDQDGIDDTFVVWYLDTTNYNITEVTDRALANPVYVYDIYKRDGKIEAIVFEEGGVNDIYAYDVDQDPSVLLDTEDLADVYQISQGVITGTSWYGILSDPGTSLNILLFNGAFTIKAILNDYELSANPAQWSVAYDGSDNLTFVVEEAVGATKYLATYSITGNSYTVGGTYNIALMLDRNCSGTIPTELEKGFGVTDKKVYITKFKKGGIVQLQVISVLQNFNIIAITDNFLMLDNDPNFPIFEWTNVSDLIGDINYNGGIIPTIKKGIFKCHPNYAKYWSTGDSIMIYDDS